VFQGTDRTVITAPLAPTGTVGAGDAGTAPPTAVNATRTERRSAVRHETNGHPPTGRPDPPDAPDPLAAAEELRASLAGALAAAGRLAAALRQRRKEKRSLASVYAGLKALNPGAEGRP
jgi:hypothetical protein